jgi:hypothetical protein
VIEVVFDLLKLEDGVDDHEVVAPTLRVTVQPDHSSPMAIVQIVRLDAASIECITQDKMLKLTLKLFGCLITHRI